MRRFRLLLILVLMIGLAPGTWLRTHIPPPDYGAPLRIAPLPMDRLVSSQAVKGDVELLGAWKLTSNNAHFGGYSALVDLGEGRLLSGSDRGRLLELPLPQNADPATSVRFDYFASTNGGPKIYADIEALEYDPATGFVWGSYEDLGRVDRFKLDAAQRITSSVIVGAMQGWPDNGGPETMVRLADGRFMIIAEASKSGSSTRSGLMFTGDPLSSPPPRRFRFAPPEGYSPVDATLLPDGRVMILVRKVIWGLPPQFATALVLADPSDIRVFGPAKPKTGQKNPWTGDMIAQIGGLDLEENFEGIAAIEQEDGSVDLYLIADDNLSAFQETLMLRLNWEPPVSKAASSEAAPSPKK